MKQPKSQQVIRKASTILERACDGGFRTTLSIPICSTVQIDLFVTECSGVAVLSWCEEVLCGKTASGGTPHPNTYCCYGCNPHRQKLSNAVVAGGRGEHPLVLDSVLLLLRRGEGVHPMQPSPPCFPNTTQQTPIGKQIGSFGVTPIFKES